MAMTWSDRLNKVVLPAILEGLHIYTALGELRPGSGIDPDTGTSPSTASKPIGLPDWQVYLEETTNRPALRFLQLTHIVRNLRGPATMLPAARPDGSRGVHLVIPLGEGLDTPENELLLHRTFHAEFLFRAVRVIALGRHRPIAAPGNWEVCEHLVMEIYSEAGDLLWTNPYMGMTLEEAIKAVRTAELTRSMPAASAPQAAPVAKVTPHAQPVLGVAEPGAFQGDKQAMVAGTIRQLVGQGADAEEVVLALARTHGFDGKVARRLFEDFRKRTEPPQEAREIVLRLVTQYEGMGPDYEGDALVEIVSEDSGLPQDLVRRVLAMIPRMPVVPSPALPAGFGTKPAAAEAVEDSSSKVLQFQGLAQAPLPERELSASFLGFVTDPAELPPRVAPPSPTTHASREKIRSVRTRSATKAQLAGDASDHEQSTQADEIIKRIHDQTEEMQGIVLAALAANKRLSPLILRGKCGIPVVGASDKGPGKWILDHFRRTVLDPLKESGQIDGNGQGRAFHYHLVRGQS